MRKWFVFMVLAAFWVSVRVPFEKTDVAKLAPVSALVFARREGRLFVTSDQGDLGIGNTLEEALEDMELTCSARIFLDTVEYLLVAPGSVEAEELCDYFRPGAYIVRCATDTDPGDAAEYLRNRNGIITLREIDMQEKEMPVLYESDGRFYFDGETRESDSAFCVDDSSGFGSAGDCGPGKRLGDESGDRNSGGSHTAGAQ